MMFEQVFIDSMKTYKFSVIHEMSRFNEIFIFNGFSILKKSSVTVFYTVTQTEFSSTNDKSKYEMFSFFYLTLINLRVMNSEKLLR